MTTFTLIKVTTIRIATAVNDIAPVSTLEASLTIHDRAVADPKTNKVKLDR